MNKFLPVLILMLLSLAAASQSQGGRVRLQELFADKNFCLDSSNKLVQSCSIETISFGVKTYNAEVAVACQVRLVGRVLTSNTHPSIGVPRVGIYTAKLSGRQLSEMTLLTESSYDPKILSNSGFFDFNLDCKERLLVFVAYGYYLRFYRVVK